MSNQTPSSVKVPSAAASYTPATLDPDLRSQINTVLLRDGHVTKIQESLLHALNAHHSDWPTAIQTHALTLLRSGEVTSYPDLLRRVLEDIRSDSLEPSTTTTSSSNGKSNSSSSTTATATNGSAAAAATDSKPANGTAGEKTSLAVPDAVIQDALRVTKESLETVCEMDGASGR